MTSRAKGYWLFLAAVLLFVAPYVAVFALGTYWTWQHGLIWYWAVGTGVPTLVGLALIERARRLVFPSAAAAPPSAPASTPTGRAAMQSVREISERLQAENLPLERPEVLEKAVRETALEILETVARHFHPNADRPALETPVAHVAALVQLVADDFRCTFTRSVPWGKTVTLGRLIWWKEKGDLGWRISMYLWQLNRIRRMIFRPATAIVQEVQDHLGQGMTAKSFDGLKRSAIDFCVMKAGEYAIQLYSGGFVLGGEYRPRLSEPSAVGPFDGEPLQVLVIGQVKSGKSSLINALLGELRAPVDVLPTTDAVDLYECSPPVVGATVALSPQVGTASATPTQQGRLLGSRAAGLPPMILRDTPGYGAIDGRSDPFASLRREIEECDLLVLVTSVRSAARKIDRELLGKIREVFKDNPKRMLPPILYVLTHIDALPDHLHVEAATAVANDFSVRPIEIVSVCTQWDHLANHDGLVTALQEKLPAAERLKISRCVRQIRREQDEDQIIRQLVHGLRLAGGWIVKKQ